MKKVLALVLAVVLCMGLGVVAFADYANTDGTQEIAITVDTDGIKAEDLKATLSWNDGKEYFDKVELDDSAAITDAQVAASGKKTKFEVEVKQGNVATDDVITIGAVSHTVVVAENGDNAKALQGWKDETITSLTSNWDITGGDGTATKLTFEAKNKGVTEIPAVSTNLKVTIVEAGEAPLVARAAGVKVTVKFKDYYGVDDIDVDFDLNLKKGSTKKPITKISIASDAAVTDTAPDTKTINVKTTFGWDKIADVAPTDRDDASITVPEIGSGAVVFDDENVTFVTFEFAAADALSVAGKMSKQDAVNMALDVAVTDEIKALMKKNEDVDFDVLNFKGAPEFDFTQEVTYSIEDEDVTYYVYEIKDGKAVKVNAKLNDDKDALVWKTRVLGCYIVTDEKIDASAAADDDKTEDGDKENPETGASDFVGVAVALGAVSLVAAGAVALKK